MNVIRAKIVENLAGRVNAVNFPVAFSGISFEEAKSEMVAMRGEGLLRVSNFPLPGESGSRASGPQMFQLTNAGRELELNS